MSDAPSRVTTANSVGWAAIRDGRILVNTVSATRRAAIVNWLWTADVRVLNTWTDERIEEEWSAIEDDVAVIEVIIAEKAQDGATHTQQTGDGG